jgi:hypothetical protein
LYALPLNAEEIPDKSSKYFKDLEKEDKSKTYEGGVGKRWD